MSPSALPHAGKSFRITSAVIEHYISDQILCYVHHAEHLLLWVDNLKTGRIPNSLRSQKYAAAQKGLCERLKKDRGIEWIRLAGFLCGAASHEFQADFHGTLVGLKQRLAPLQPILVRVAPQIFSSADEPYASFEEPNFADWALLREAAEAIRSSFSGFREKHRSELLHLMLAALLSPREILPSILPRHLPEILQS